jgi:hypothetical protein
VGNLRKNAVIEFQGYVDKLIGEFGVVQVVVYPDGQRIELQLAGIRVLNATPIFNRDTGKVKSWRYWIMFADQGLLDVFSAGHTVRSFECSVKFQDDISCVLTELHNQFKFLLYQNDQPDTPGDIEAHDQWQKQVKRIGGPLRLKEILDEKAQQSTAGLKISGEAK